MSKRTEKSARRARESAGAGPCDPTNPFSGSIIFPTLMAALMSLIMALNSEPLGILRWAGHAIKVPHSVGAAVAVSTAMLALFGTIYILDRNNRVAIYLGTGPRPYGEDNDPSGPIPPYPTNLPPFPVAPDAETGQESESERKWADQVRDLLYDKDLPAFVEQEIRWSWWALGDDSGVKLAKLLRTKLTQWETLQRRQEASKASIKKSLGRSRKIFIIGFFSNLAAVLAGLSLLVAGQSPQILIAAYAVIIALGILEITAWVVLVAYEPPEGYSFFRDPRILPPR